MARTENQARHYKRGRVYEKALVYTAQELGKEHPITKAMGSAAWGRHDFEFGPQPNTATFIRYAAGLEGMFRMLIGVCNVYSPEVTRILLRTHQTAQAEGEI